MNELQTNDQANTPSSRDEGQIRSTDVVLQLVTFSLLNEKFGVPILDVQEIIRMTEITPVPQAPGFVEGVINLRGQIIPVVDLRKRFGLQANDQDSNTRIVVIEVHSNVLGLIVDSVSEVLRIPHDTVSPPPALVANSIGAEYIKGISHYQDEMIILIDLKRVFSSDEIESLSA